MIPYGVMTLHGVKLPHDVMALLPWVPQALGTPLDGKQTNSSHGANPMLNGTPKCHSK